MTQQLRIVANTWAREEDERERLSPELVSILTKYQTLDKQTSTRCNAQKIQYRRIRDCLVEKKRATQIGNYVSLSTTDYEGEYFLTGSAFKHQQHGIVTSCRKYIQPRDDPTTMPKGSHRQQRQNWTGSGDGCEISLQQTWNWDQDVFIGGRWIKVLDRTLQRGRRHSAFSNVQCLWHDKGNHAQRQSKNRTRK